MLLSSDYANSTTTAATLGGRRRYTGVPAPPASGGLEQSLEQSTVLLPGGDSAVFNESLEGNEILDGASTQSMIFSQKLPTESRDHRADDDGALCAGDGGGALRSTSPEYPHRCA